MKGHMSDQYGAGERSLIRGHWGGKPSMARVHWFMNVGTMSNNIDFAMFLLPYLFICCIVIDYIYNITGGGKRIWKDLDYITSLSFNFYNIIGFKIKLCS